MGNLARFHTADLPALLDRINKNSIGVDEYINRLFELQNETTSYPPYNLVQLSNVESRLEIALAGFKKKKSMSTLSTESSLSMEKRRQRRTNKLRPQRIGSEIFHQILDPLR